MSNLIFGVLLGAAAATLCVFLLREAPAPEAAVADPQARRAEPRSKRKFRNDPAVPRG